jgi:hypothetical protein
LAGIGPVLTSFVKISIMIQGLCWRNGAASIMPYYQHKWFALLVWEIVVN